MEQCHNPLLEKILGPLIACNFSSKQGKSIAVQEMLMAYRDTLHPATGVSSYQAMTGGPIRTKLDNTTTVEEEVNKQDQKINLRDAQYKEKIEKNRASKSKDRSIIQGDYVLVIATLTQQMDHTI